MMFMIYVTRAFLIYMYMMFIIAKGMLPKHSSFQLRNKSGTKPFALYCTKTDQRQNCLHFPYQITCLLQNMYISFI